MTAPLVISLNLRRRQVATREQIEALTVELLKEHPEWSDRKVGEMVGRDHKTVAGTRKKAETRGEIPHVGTRTDSKGRSQPATKAKGTVPLDDPSRPRNRRKVGTFKPTVTDAEVEYLPRPGPPVAAEIAPRHRNLPFPKLRLIQLIRSIAASRTQWIWCRRVPTR